MSTCCCTPNRFKEEWKLSLFTVEDYNGKIIDVQKTFTPSPLWLVFRFAILVWIGLAFYDIFSIPNYPILFWFSYYTHWSVIIATTYFFFSFILTFQQWRNPSQEVTWLVRAVWILFSIGSVTQLSATVLYWILVYTGGPPGYIELLFHGLIVSVLLFDGFVVSFVPIRLKFIIPMMVINALYIGWSVIHSVANIGNPFNNRGAMTDDDAIYAALNWNQRPGTAAFWSIVSNVIIFPLLFLLTFAIGSLGGGCKFDGSCRRYVEAEDGEGAEADEESPLTSAEVYGSTN